MWEIEFVNELPSLGAQESLTIPITEELVERFAEYCGDRNPLHLDNAFAVKFGFESRVAHGMSYVSHLSTLIGMHLPGPGALWASQSIQFVAPVFIGDEVKLTVTVSGVDLRGRVIRMSVEAVNQKGQQVMSGESEVLLPRDKSTLTADAIRQSTINQKAQGSAQVALIAGASGDLGASIAKELTEAGLSVALCGRRTTLLETLADELVEGGAQAVPITMDLKDDGSVNEGIKLVESSLGAVAQIIHCATAELDNSSVANTEFDVFSNHFDIQVGGLLRLFHASIERMCEMKNGQFIYIGSTATQGPPPKGLAAYTTAKSAGKSLIRSIGLDYAQFGVRANIVSPYFLETGLNAHISTKARMLATAQTPIRRLADISEIAHLVGFLVSSKSSAINGQDLIVDGGVTMS